ncbi:MAG: winged helix-turn-helix domain-containing protein, partial [Ignavibacteriaceae bacterium]
NKVCTRTRIIEHVWDIHFEADTSVIDVYINFLRKKLELNNKRNFIQTIRGVGYIAKDDE